MELREFIATMMGTVEKVLNPFHLITCFLGCGIFKHSLDHSRFYLNIFYILIVWSVYAYAFYYMVIFFTPNRIFTGFLLFFMIMTNLSVTIISIIITVREHEKFFSCIRNLSLVDDTLELLGTPKEYCKMRKAIKWILIVLFMMICITYALHAYLTKEEFQDTRAVIIPIVLHYPFHLNILLDIIFTFLLRYIGTRFDKINDYIGQLSETKECGLRCAWKKSPITHHIRYVKNREHVLWIAMHLHLELCRIARNINNFFGMRMTLQMISNFIVLIGMFYFQYHIVICFKQIYRDTVESKLTLIYLINFNIWCGVYLTRLVTLNYICESICAKAEKTKDMIHKLTNLVYYDRIRENICQFILQISLRSLKFDGMGLFYFGYKFILKFIVGIVSILIFMVQMADSPLSRMLISSEFLRQHVTTK